MVCGHIQENDMEINRILFADMDDKLLDLVRKNTHGNLSNSEMGALKLKWNTDLTWNVILNSIDVM